MEVNFTISKRTNKLLNIMADLEGVNEKMLRWITEEFGEDSSKTSDLYDAHKVYMGFMQQQLAESIETSLNTIGSTEI